MTTELQTYTAQLPAVPDVPPTQVEWIAKVRQSPVLRMDEDQATTAIVAALVQIAPYLTEPAENDGAEVGAVLLGKYDWLKYHVLGICR